MFSLLHHQNQLDHRSIRWYINLQLLLLLFLIEGWSLYRILLYSVRPQNKSTIDIYLSPPFWNSLPSPSLSHTLGLAFFMGLHIASTLNQMAWMRILLLCLLLFLSTTCYLHYRTGILDWGWRLLTFQICTVIWQPMTVLFLNYNTQAIHVSQGQRSLIHLLPLFQGQLINHLHYLKIILIQLIYQTGVRLCRVMKIRINVGRYQQIPTILLFEESSYMFIFIVSISIFK